MVAPPTMESVIRIGSLADGFVLSAADVAQLSAKLQWALTAWLRERHEPTAAAAVLDQIEARSGETLGVMEERARLAFAAGESATAIAILTERVDRAPSASAWIKLGRLLMATGDRAAAAAIGDDLRRDHPEMSSVQAFVADLELAAGSDDTRWRYHESVLQAEPGHVGARLGLARLSLRKGDALDAVALLQPVIGDESSTRRQLAEAAEIANSCGEMEMASALRARSSHLAAAETTRLADAIRAALGRSDRTGESGEQSIVATHDVPRSPDAELADPALPAEVGAALADHFGHPAFRPGQATVIKQVLDGTDTLAIMPTGAGKSLTFQLPALLLDGTTLVISPLIALMKDQVEGLPPAVRDRTALLNSSLNPGEQQRVLAGIADGAYKLIYIAPERLRHHAFLRALQSAGVARVVVDEAHCISLWGHDFRPDYLTIPHALPALGSPPVLAITATATPEMADAIAAGFGRPLTRVTLSVFRANLFYEAYQVANREAKISKLFAICREERGTGIVYVSSRRDAESIAALLRDRGIAAVPYHAGLAPEQRAANQQRFMQGQVRVVVATVAFGMGIDKADVRFIVHLNPPRSLEAYAQESGRAGRDGQRARCVMLAAPSDKASMRRFARRDEQSVDDVRRLYTAIQRQAVGRWAVIDIDQRRPSRNAELDGDEAMDPRITLGVLQQAGLTRRHPDAPVSWAVHPQSSRAVGTRAREPAADPLWERFATWSGLSEAGGQGVTVRTVDAAAALDITPIALARLLSERLEIGVREGTRQVCLELLPVGDDATVRVTSVLTRAREAAEQRIADVMRYATGDRCRHVTLARHLGEVLGPCRTACDNCTRDTTPRSATGRERPPSEARQTIGAADAVTILQAVRSLPFDLGKTGLSRLVSGSHESRIRADRSPHFAALAHLKKGQIDTLIDRLVEHGYLDRDLDHEYKLIRLTQRGAVASESDLAALADATPASARATGATGLSLDAAGMRLLEQLTAWRRERAARDQMPPYVIAHNSMLEAIAATRPDNLDALAAIKGYGPAKIEKYGDEILAIVAESTD